MIKFFSQDLDQTWYASEFDGSDTLYGLIVNQGLEIGYFSLAELEQLGANGLPIGQALDYEPQTVHALRDFHREELGIAPEAMNPPEDKQTLLQRLCIFAEKLSEWDSRLAEVFAIGELAANEPDLERKAEDYDLDLICTYTPDPPDPSRGFALLGQIVYGRRFEEASYVLGFRQSIELGFRMEEEIYLPGRLLPMPALDKRITLWTRATKDGAG